MLQSMLGVGSGGSGLVDALPAAVRELQSIATKVVAGAAANTNIAVPGLADNGTVLSVVAFNAGVPSVPTPAAGNTDGFRNGVSNIRLTEVTTGNSLLVKYVNKG
jgi:hypothetical protein